MVVQALVRILSELVRGGVSFALACPFAKEIPFPPPCLLTLLRPPAQADGRGDGAAAGTAAGDADGEAVAEALRALCNLCQTFPSPQGLAQGMRRQDKRHEKADWAVAAGVVRPLMRFAESRPALADLVRRSAPPLFPHTSAHAGGTQRARRGASHASPHRCARPAGARLPLLAPGGVGGHTPPPLCRERREAVPQPPQQPDVAGARGSTAAAFSRLCRRPALPQRRLRSTLSGGGGTLPCRCPRRRHWPRGSRTTPGGSRPPCSSPTRSAPARPLPRCAATVFPPDPNS